jgi:hypothetical protein
MISSYQVLCWPCLHYWYLQLISKEMKRSNGEPMMITYCYLSLKTGLYVWHKVSRVQQQQL